MFNRDKRWKERKQDKERQRGNRKNKSSRLCYRQQTGNHVQTSKRTLTHRPKHPGKKYGHTHTTTRTHTHTHTHTHLNAPPRIHKRVRHEQCCIRIKHQKTIRSCNIELLASSFPPQSHAKTLNPEKNWKCILLCIATTTHTDAHPLEPPPKTKTQDGLRRSQEPPQTTLGRPPDTGNRQLHHPRQPCQPCHNQIRAFVK